MSTGMSKRAHDAATLSPFHEPEICKRCHVFMYTPHVALSPSGQIPYRYLARTQ